MSSYNLLEIGTRIKNQRILLGYSREDLASRAGITPRYCYDLEQGLKNMSLTTLCAMSEALDVSLDYLVFGIESKSDKYSSIESLLNACPDSLIPYLENIVSNFVLANKR